MIIELPSNIGFLNFFEQIRHSTFFGMLSLERRDLRSFDFEVETSLIFNHLCVNGLRPLDET